MNSRRFLALCLLLIACGLYRSWANPSPLPDTVSTAYQGLRDAVYNSEPLLQIESLYLGSLETLSAAGRPSRESRYWGSRFECLVARGYRTRGDKKQTALHCERGLALIEEAMAEGSFSEGWRMKSELLGQLCLVKGLGFVIANGLKARNYAEEALRIDPGNAAAQIFVASSRIYPPALFGGNPRLGIELLQKAIALGPAERDDLFNIYSGLGMAHQKLRDFADARSWFAKALELFPGNAFVRQEYARLAP